MDIENWIFFYGLCFIYMLGIYICQKKINNDFCCKKNEDNNYHEIIDV